MGMVFGKISEETPKHIVVHRASQYEIRRYVSSVAAVVHANDVTDPKTNQIPTEEKFTGIAFGMLAKYIGVFTNPQNTASTSETTQEKIEMTAPVVMNPPSEKIAMTAPVVMDPPSEKVSMTAPVVVDPSSERTSTNSDKNASAAGATMKFLLPSKYQTIDQAPKPTNPAVKLEMVDSRCEAVYTFNGNFNMVRAAEMAAKFVEMLNKDNVKITGDWNVQGYNPPFTLPMFKRNEIHIPVDSSAFPEEEIAPEQASS